jgi:hypothetical protein
MKTGKENRNSTKCELQISRFSRVSRVSRVSRGGRARGGREGSKLTLAGGGEFFLQTFFFCVG